MTADESGTFGPAATGALARESGSSDVRQGRGDGLIGSGIAMNASGNEPAPPRLELRGITKVYPAVVANDGVDLLVRRGEIHALLGENGAGKSTLMKLVYGTNQPDAGTILWEGEEVRIGSPAEARALGIGMVFQHFALFETLTVAQNISLAVKGSLESLSARIVEAGERFGLPLAPYTRVHSLSVGERQRVEIIRCILQDPTLLIMDEPTSVLPPQGVEALFETLRRLRANGCSILYISHKLDEIRALCDRATVLRDGRVVGTADPRRESADALARLMIGRDVPRTERGERAAPGPVRLALRGVSHVPTDPFGNALDAVTLEVAGGEIVGIAGISGNGQGELVRLISGERTLEAAAGEAIRIDDAPVGALGPAARRAKGLNVVPEERLGRGAVPPMSLADNGLLTAHANGLSRFGLIRHAATRAFARRCIEDNDVRCGGTRAVAGSLSGGNLQKFIVGREVALAPRVLVLSQPTWGVDVGAAARIRQTLVDLRDAGAAVLVISEELEELLEISDRLHVMHGGRLSPSLAREAADIETIGRWMSGAFLADDSPVSVPPGVERERFPRTADDGESVIGRAAR